MSKSTSTILLLAFIGFMAMSSIFIVDQRERAILFQLGEIVQSDVQPGLHFKIPLMNNVRKFDGRILTLDSEAERFLTSEKKNLLVDSFVKWRILDVGRYFTTVSGDPRSANLRIDQVIKDGLRGEFSKRTIDEVVSGDRQEIMDVIRKSANIEAQKIGIEVVDVRIKRIDLPDDVSNAVYRRMQAERSREARDIRSKGAEAAERIRARADRTRIEIVANAYREAEETKGQGDAIATDTYAKAYGKNPEFFALTRSLTAYKEIFKGGNDFLVIEPDSEFFKFFKDESGK